MSSSPENRAQQDLISRSSTASLRKVAAKEQRRIDMGLRMAGASSGKTIEVRLQLPPAAGEKDRDGALRPDVPGKREERDLFRPSGYPEKPILPLLSPSRRQPTTGVLYTTMDALITRLKESQRQR